MKPTLRKVTRFIALALIAGVVGSSMMRIIFYFDPDVLAARRAIARDPKVSQILGNVSIDDVSVFGILKTGDDSQVFAREEHSASVTGSSHSAMVRVLIKKSYFSGETLGEPEIIEIDIRE